MSSLFERIKALRSDPYCASTYLGNEHVGSFLREVEEALGAVSRITDTEIDKAFPFDGSDPDTVIECRRRVRELLRGESS